MELHEGHSAGVLLAHNGVGKALGGEGLAHAGSSLQNDVFLVSQQPGELVVLLIGHKDFVQEIGGGVSCLSCCLLFILN